MLDTNRFGSIAVSSSSRVHETLVATRCVYGSFGGIRGLRSTVGSAFTFFVMKTRPVLVAAHAVNVSAVVLSTAATLPPARSPQAEAVKRTGPSSAQSPHVMLGWKSPVHVLQCSWASAMVIEPRPCVFVRYAVRPVPANIVPLTTGSLMIGASKFDP